MPHKPIKHTKNFFKKTLEFQLKRSKKMNYKNSEHLQKTIHEQQKIIEFYQEKYFEHTGNELEMPQTWYKNPYDHLP